MFVFSVCLFITCFYHIVYTLLQLLLESHSSWRHSQVWRQPRRIWHRGLSTSGLVIFRGGWWISLLNFLSELSETKVLEGLRITLKTLKHVTASNSWVPFRPRSSPSHIPATSDRPQPWWGDQGHCRWRGLSPHSSPQVVDDLPIHTLEQ